MADFTSDNTPIQASRKRVVALYKAVVDRIDLKSTSRFSGFAVLVTVFTVSANYQYHLVFMDNTFKPVEIWHFDVPLVSHSGVQEIEKDIVSTGRQLGIMFVPLVPGNVEFQTTLAKLPMAFDDDNATPMTGFCIGHPVSSSAGRPRNVASDGTVPGISKEAKKALSDFFIQF